MDGAAELTAGSTTTRAAVMDIGTPKRSNQRSHHHSAHGEGKAYTMRCGFRMPLADNPSSSAKEMGDAEGEPESTERENAEQNTTGAGKPKAVQRQMSLP